MWATRCGIDLLIHEATVLLLAEYGFQFLRLRRHTFQCLLTSKAHLTQLGVFEVHGIEAIALHAIRDGQFAT